MTIQTYPLLRETVYSCGLSNGLQVRIIRKPGFSKTQCFFAVRYGSIDTDFSIRGSSYHTPDGVAHFLEHKMFDMPDGNAMQQFSLFGGSPNAFTSYDMTAYYVECTDNIEENLKMLLRFVSCPYFTPESVEKEQGIISQEIHMYEDSADSRVMENLFSALYAYHPIKKSIVGTNKTIHQISDKTLYQCYNAFYTPSNMFLCVVGDVDPQLVVDLAEEAACEGNVSAATDYGKAEIMVPKQQRITDTMEVSMPTFAIGFKTEPLKDGKASMLQEVVGDLASELLFGESASLYAKLYENNLIDSSFSAGYETVRGASLLAISGDSCNPDAVLEEILCCADRALKNGLDKEHFIRLQSSVLGRYIRDLDSFSGICYRTSAYHFRGADYFSFPDVFQQIKLDHIEAFLNRVIDESRCAISLINPTNTDKERTV